MPSRTQVINLGGVNCYLILAGDGFILIDTGFRGKRTQLEKRLDNAGCTQGKLKLIVLTHGDSDHADNCAYLRRKYGCKVAMHRLDSGMVEQGDMSLNRKAKPDRVSATSRVMGFVVSLFVKGAKTFEKFSPDIMVDEGFDLSAFGLDAKILHLPGHSKGSIGILTTDGKLFCGDFAYNLLGFEHVDDMADHNRSMEKLIQHKIDTIYPGHGKPFSMQELINRA